MELLIAIPHSLSSVFWAIRFSFLLVILYLCNQITFSSPPRRDALSRMQIIVNDSRERLCVRRDEIILGCFLASPLPRTWTHRSPRKRYSSERIASRQRRSQRLNVLIRLICRDEFALIEPLVNISRGAIRLWADSSRQIQVGVRSVSGRIIYHANRSLSLETKFGWSKRVFHSW